MLLLALVVIANSVDVSLMNEANFTSTEAEMFYGFISDAIHDLEFTRALVISDQPDEVVQVKRIMVFVCFGWKGGENATVNACPLF